MITAYGTIDGAVAATKQGAFYYFTKPFKNDEVLAVLRNAIDRRRLVRENRELRDRLRSGRIALRRDHRRQREDEGRLRPDFARRAQPHDGPHPGRERHGQGAGRAGGPSSFGAIGPARSSPSTPATCRRICSRSNLFGHVKGAFTGAVFPQEGPVRAGRQGHDLLRRDRQHPARHAGQAAARAFRNASSCGSAASRRSRSTCASSPRPT